MLKSEGKDSPRNETLNSPVGTNSSKKIDRDLLEISLGKCICGASNFLCVAKL